MLGTNLIQATHKWPNFRFAARKLAARKCCSAAEKKCKQTTTTDQYKQCWRDRQRVYKSNTTGELVIS